MLIYKATNLINGKVYVGQTTQTLDKRRKQHENSYNHACKCRAFARAIQKYGKENFKWEIIDTASSLTELSEKEVFWINKCESLVDYGKGYNLNTGGSNPNHSEETKKRIGMAQMGIKNHMYGKKGKFNKTSKPVINLTLNIKYDNVALCVEAEDVSESHVCSVCRGERATTNGNVYRYLDTNGNVIEPKIKVKTRNKKIINLTTNQIYPSIRDVAKITDKTTNAISYYLRKGNGIFWMNNQLWKYLDLTEYVIPSKTSIRSDAKKVRNCSTNEIFNSLSLAAESIGNKFYRNLATALRKGNGHCKWSGYIWEEVK